MATTTTRVNFRRALMDDLREYGPKPGLGIGIYFSAATVTATGFTTTDYRLTPSDWKENALRGWRFMNDPAAVSEIRICNAHSVTTGTATLSTYGSNMTTAGSAKTCELWHPAIDPDEVNRILADAQNLIWTPYRALLTIGPIADHDQASSGTTSWTGSSGTTLSKITVSAPNNVPLLNYQSQRVVNDSANDYSASGALLLPANQYRLVGFARSAVGNSILRLQGPSASVDSVTNAGEAAFSFFDKEVEIATEGSHTLRLENDSASGDSYWGAVGLQPTGRGTFALPSWVDNNHKLESVQVATFHKRIGTDYYTANEYSLTPFKGYRYESTTFGANPHRMEITERPYGPLFITGSRTHYDIGEVLATEAATTSADLASALAVAKYLLGERYPELLPGLERKYARKVDNLAVLRQQEPVQEPSVRMMFR